MTAGRKVEQNTWLFPLSTNLVSIARTPAPDGGGTEVALP